MGDVSEIQEAKKWIRAVLTANVDIAAVVGTRVFADRSPSPVVFPYIIYNFLGGTDVQGLGTARLLARPLFQVRVVGEGSPNTDARKVDKRIDTVLQNAVNQQSGDYYFSARREQPVDRPELDPATNKVFFNLGGLFRLYIGRKV